MREIDVGSNANFKVTCDEHKHIGDLPCPWPNCERGIVESEFIAVSHISFREIKHSSNMHYKRRKWTAINGDERYSWDEQNISALLRIDRILEAENLRTISHEIDYSNQNIYHYTNIQGLQGIIDSGSLWMTDFQYMNDSLEINHGIQLAESVLLELKNSERYSNKEEYFKILEKFVEIGVDRRICISCFSLDHGDSLSQWRGYGDRGVGISIGFDIFELQFMGKGFLTLNKVMYDTEQQRKFLANFFHICFTVVDWDSDKNITNAKGEKIEQRTIEDIANSFITRLYQHIVFFKHHSFEDEKEVRWVYLENDGVLNMMGWKPFKKNFRTVGNKLIPYLSIEDLPDIKGNEETTTKLPITEIVVGPQKDSDLVVSGIRELLQEHGYSHVNVRKSTVPFRSH